MNIGKLEPVNIEELFKHEELSLNIDYGIKYRMGRDALTPYEGRGNLKRENANGSQSC